MIRITAQKLIDIEACPEGIDLFERYAGQVYEVDDYDLDCQLAIIRGPLGEHWGWAVANGFLPAWSMHYVDLCGANLRGADLSGADLRSANLRGANLRGANLRRADLCSANLHGANLHGANLRSANLHGADLSGAGLRGANLRGANLRGANLRGAFIRNVIIDAKNKNRHKLTPGEVEAI